MKAVAKGTEATNDPKPKLVTDWVHLWPREALRSRNKAVRTALRILDKGGIYILYRDDIPYYVGRTGTRKGERTIRKRLDDHQPGRMFGYFWNFFSVWVVEDLYRREEIELILISAMPTLANRQKPRKTLTKMPTAVRDLIVRKV